MMKLDNYEYAHPYFIEEESNEPNRPNISEFDSDAFWSDDYVVQGRNSEEGEDLMDEGSDELEGDKKDTDALC